MNCYSVIIIKNSFIFSTQLITAEENSNYIEQNEEQERPVTHISTKSSSRPNSSPIKKDSKPDSISVFQQSLYKKINYFSSRIIFQNISDVPS